MSMPSAEALFRYQVISHVRSQMLSGERKRDAVSKVAALGHMTFDGRLRRVATRTLYRWLRAFEKTGGVGLEPGKRGKNPGEITSAIPKKLLDFTRQEKEDDTAASIPELIRRARQRGVITKELKVDRSTLYRSLLRSGVSLRRRKSAKERDARRFAYPHRMMMVLSDGKHFRAGAVRAKRLAMFFLDDSSRFGLHAVVGPSESKKLFLRGLYEAIRKFGLMSIFYLDHGAGFIAEDTVAVMKSLGVSLIHGEVAYPEGHGKIERFHRTATADLLRGLDGRPDVDPDCGALEIRLQHYLAEVYDQNPHESLDQETPFKRFNSDPRALIFPESDADLRQRFVIYEVRRVSSDRVVKIDDVAYEMPRGYSGQKVTLQKGLLDGSIRFLHEDRLIQLQKVDLAQNAESRRADGSLNSTEPPRSLKKSAADLAFDKDFRPVVSKDGGLIHPFEESSP